MRRIKVINEPTELVPILRAMDSDVKYRVFQKLSEEWVTLEGIQTEFGDEGKKALILFEKTKLVEARWQQAEGKSKPVKAYHTYYTSFHINTSAPVNEVLDIFNVAMLDEAEFEKMEARIYEQVGENGIFLGKIQESEDISPIKLKSLIKRSSLLELRGHRVERFIP